MNKLEKLSAAYKKISNAEKEMVFGGAKTSFTDCETPTCTDDDYQDNRLIRTTDHGLVVIDWTVVYDTCCGD